MQIIKKTLPSSARLRHCTLSSLGREEYLIFFILISNYQTNLRAVLERHTISEGNIVTMKMQPPLTCYPREIYVRQLTTPLHLH